MTFKDLVEIVDRIEKSVIAAEFKEDYTYEIVEELSSLRIYLTHHNVFIDDDNEGE